MDILLVICAVIIFICTSCSTTKFVPDGKYLLTDVKIETDNKNVNTSQMEQYINQKANTKWFSLFAVPLGTYNLSGRDSTKWINRILKRLGEEPVLFDTLKAEMSRKNLGTVMQNMGYLHADVSLKTIANDKKIKVIYTLHTGKPYFIGNIEYDIYDKNIAQILDMKNENNRGLKKGMIFSINNLENERKRITNILSDSGYYKFNKDYIIYEADSTRTNDSIDVNLKLMKFRANSKSPEKDHNRYYINKVNFTSADGDKIKLRRSVLSDNLAIKEGAPFCEHDLQTTYNNFARLQAVKYTNIRFEELPDTSLLNCNIQLSTNKPNTISFQPEGTNTAGDLGAAASLTYENRNLFHGSEMLSIQLRAAFEAITGLEGYQAEDYEEYNIEGRLMFPRFIAPFLSENFRRNSNAHSELTVSYNLQNRPEFHRRVFTAAWKYLWNAPKQNSTYRFDLIDLNYVYMPWISEKFKEDYLDDDSNRNAILRYNYEDLFIMKMGFGMTYNNGVHAIKANIETSGNLLSLLSGVSKFDKNSQGQYTLFNIAFAQYVKADFDYTRLFTFDWRNSLALHFGFGIAYPYGNSKILPFEKRYFSGGANSVRGWNVRELGPGKFKGTDGRIDFINQTGDMKLDFNLEYRTALFWKFNGAFFIDAGNIWTLRSYADQPGGQFKFDEFYKQIAVSYGLGIRLNLDYFILRLDMGVKAINPAYTTAKEHYPIISPNFKRDFSLHFAVGLPF
jgi:outer membrane protein assembly factor BamA